MSVKSVVMAILISFASSTCFAANTENNVTWLKQQRFTACKKANVGRLVDNYMDSARWAYGGTNPQNQALVNVTCKKSSEKATLQFTIFQSQGKFQFSLTNLWIDGVAQTKGTRIDLIDAMCNNI